MRLRRLLLPVLFAVPVLAVLLALGTWQLGRLAWKEALLADLARAQAGPAVPLGPDTPVHSKVVLSGRFDHGQEALLGAEVRGNRMGAHLVVPLRQPNGVTILVDRGWVPVERDRPINRPEGEVTLEGHLRDPDQSGWFTPAPDLAARRFFAFDTRQLCAALVAGPCEARAVVALAGADERADALPAASRSLPRPNNNHLGYVITWYGLAVSLVGVLAVFLRRRWKDSA